MKALFHPPRFASYLVALLACCLLACGPAESDPLPDDNPSPSRPVAGEPALEEWPEYRNRDYGFALPHPPSWTALEARSDSPFPLINLYPQSAENTADFPLDVHGPAGVSYVAVFPKGFGTELPSGASAPLSQASAIAAELGDDWDRERSLVFRLADDTVWGLLLRPRERPADWSLDGYLFAQFRVDDFKTRCFAGGSDREISMQACDPLSGDRVARYGTVATEARQATLRALAGWSFTAPEDRREPIGNLIRVERPLPNNNVSSSLEIEGRARGYWYFEADFPVRLEDYQGNVLARGVASAQDEWMTEDFVPFSAELSFRAPDDERGYLVFERANPSGKPENDRSFRLPVIFPPRSK